MRQKSIGEVLRAARESRGWTFVDLQRMTKIHARYLQALEYNDFDSISEDEDVDYVLTVYADALELDADVLLEAYDSNSLIKYREEGEEEILAAELKRSYRVKKKDHKSFLPLIYLLLASAFIIIFVTYIAYSRMQNQVLPASETSYSVVGQTATSTSSETSTPEQSTTSSSSISAKNISISGSGDYIVATVTETVYPVEVTLSVKDATSWISLSGTELAEGVVLSPENPTVTTSLPEGTSEAYLVLGVVKGVDITIAGQQLDTKALTSDTGSIGLVFE
ncbi:helix-turn-helix domain-containing protein [Streptococcus iners]|uniref:Helix-turn-helix domain-containing protein n=1 Tax=Streptococcus iners TaxID=3028084 RepID=A0AA96VMT6_9STRE|nr:helix-turn-helix domain-containing protein [Streptococcus sp. 29887]MCK4024734.1 helix-turn-helix domain-containing protein [Streptococcus suis]WNY51099.1 helix-turn-helix domain-containing protein [Streptococcus sp. 29887]HEL1613533.1 helix-turn-helix domain-containing protein [Streptococcus suis]HEM4128820.1 helix-turn-helix domain-containing protein [Streptococcus suis]